MSKTIHLDLRGVPSSMRPRRILEFLEGFQEGDFLELVSDGDNRTLRDRLRARKPGQFKWVDQGGRGRAWKAMVVKAPEGLGPSAPPES